MKISHRICFNGCQWLYRFKNGYGASVVCHENSYGGHEGLFELAVIHWYSNGKWHLFQQSKLTVGGVIGWLTPDEVARKLHEIAAYY